MGGCHVLEGPGTTYNDAIAVVTGRGYSGAEANGIVDAAVHSWHRVMSLTDPDTRTGRLWARRLTSRGTP